MGKNIEIDPEVKKRIQEYRNRPDVKERTREYTSRSKGIRTEERTSEYPI